MWPCSRHCQSRGTAKGGWWGCWGVACMCVCARWGGWIDVEGLCLWGEGQAGVLWHVHAHLMDDE